MTAVFARKRVGILDCDESFGSTRTRVSGILEQHWGRSLLKTVEVVLRWAKKSSGQPNPRFARSPTLLARDRNLVSKHPTP